MNAALRTISLFAVVATTIFAARVAVAEDKAQGDTPSPSPTRVWLSDLPERNVKVGWGSFGKNGQAGFEPGSFTTQGSSCEHGLGTHVDSHVEFVLGKKYRTFSGTAAMCDTSKPGPRPIEFRVLGDGKQLWISYGMRGPSNAEPFLLDIAGVDVLTLETRYRPGTTGDGGWAHSVWVDPYVAVDPPSPTALGWCDPKRYLDMEKADDFDDRLRDLFAKEDFAQLEKVAKGLREKDVFYFGRSMRGRFFATIGSSLEKSENGWKQYMARLERWQKAQSDSPVPEILLGMAWLNKGWTVRGGGYANTVPSEVWPKFEDCLKRAHEYLETAAKNKIGEPQVYCQLISVSLSEDRPRKEIDDLLEKGIKLEPRFHALYGSMANYLLPQWHGRPGDLQKFAADIRKRLGGDLGDEVYFRIACERVNDSVDRFFTEDDFHYGDLKPGILVMLRDYPDNSYYFNHACHMACLANDKELAAPMLNRIDSANCWPFAWGSFARVEHWRRVIDPSSYQGEELKMLSTESGWVRGVAFLNSKSRLISAGYVPHFDVWDLKTEKAIDSFEAANHVRALAIDGNASQVIVATGDEQSPDSNAVVYNLQGDHSRRILKGHSGSVVNVAISRDGSLYGTAARDNTARIWKRADLEKPITLKHPEWVYDIAFSPDGKTAATASYQGGVWLWNADTGEALGEPLVKMQNGPWQCRLCFVPVGKALITASADGTIRRWDLATRKFQQAKPDGDNIFGLAVSPDGKWVAVGRLGGRIDVLLVDSLKLVHSYRGHKANTQAVAFSPDSKVLVSGSDDGTIKFWPINETWALPTYVRQSPDGTLLLKPVDANLHGGTIRYVSNSDDLGYWDDQQDWVDWNAQIEKPGKFEVMLSYGMAKGSGGSQYRIAAGSATLTGTVRETGDWGIYTRERVGEIEIAKPERIAISVKALSRPGQAVMNLKLIEIRPAK